MPRSRTKPAAATTAPLDPPATRVAEVRLDQLRFGREAGDIDARATNRRASIDELAADIAAHGLINPLGVRRAFTDVELYDVFSGNRRLAALRQLVTAGRRSPDAPVAVSIYDLADDASALELSLAANVQTVPLHPVDEHEAFARLAVTQSAREIADRFGTTERHVAGRLALAALAPKLRQAWRSGHLSAEQAKALTLAPDHDRQLQVWTAAKKSHGDWGLQPEQLRREIARGYIDEADGRVKFVGVAAYEAAGGTFHADLFSDAKLLVDVALVDTLVEARLKERCGELLFEGWAWAEVRQDHYGAPRADLTPFLTDDERAELAGRPHYQREAEIRAAGLARLEADPAARARCGCTVWLRWQGEVEVVKGLLRDERQARIEEEFADEDEAIAAEAAGTPTMRAGGGTGTPVAEPEKRVTAALAQTLSEQLTVAASRALAEDGALALCVAIAALGMSGQGAPAVLRADGMPGLPDPRLGMAFATQLAVAIGMTTADRLKRLAGLVARSLDLTVAGVGVGTWQTGKGVTKPAIDALLAALPAEPFRAAIAGAFDPEGYFARVPGKLCTEALLEMGRAGAVARDAKKADLARAATDGARETGWLPPELRTTHYVAPGAAKPAGRKRAAARPPAEAVAA